jgi:hypothetical protein
MNFGKEVLISSEDGALLLKALFWEIIYGEGAQFS